MRRVLAIAFALLLFAGPPAGAQQAVIPALNARVTDTTGTLDAAAVARIEAPLAGLEREKGAQIAVLIVPSTAPESIEAYAVRAFEQWKLGRQGVDDGVLLLVAKDDRNVRIEVGYGLEGAIPDVTAYRVIQEYLVPRLREGDFAGGIEAAVGVLAKLVDGEALPEPVSANHVGDEPGFDPQAEDRGLSLLPFAVVALLIGRAILGVLMKSWWRRALIGGAVVALVAGFLFGWAAPVLGLGFIVGFVFAAIRDGSGGGGRGYASSGSWGGYGGGSSRSSGGGGWSGGGGRSGGGGASGSW